MNASPIERVSGRKLPSKVMVVSMLSKVDESEAVEKVRGGSGWAARAAAPHSCHEKGSMGSENLGGGGGTLT